MHEYAIVRSLFDRIEDELKRHAASRVVGVRLLIGELAGVDPVLLKTAFETFSENTPCRGANLDIERVVARWRCTLCGRDLAPGARLQCALCGRGARLEQGYEIILERLEMEVSDV